MGTINPATERRRDPPTFQVERLLGSVTGLLEDVQFLGHERGFEGRQLATATPANLGRYDHAGDAAFDAPVPDPGEVTAMGKGEGFAETLVGAVGEFAERYCGYWLPDPDAPEVERGSYDDLAAAGATLPAFEYLDRYEPGQLRGTAQRPFDRETVLRWVPGTALLDGATVHAPQELVYLGHPTRYFATSSNGYACHVTKPEALLGSLYECVERDALLDAWFHGRSPPRLSLEGFPELAAERDRLETAHADVHLLAVDGRTDVHVVAAAFVDERDDAPKALVCAGAHLDFRAAVADALAELAQAVAFVRWHLACTGAPVPGRTASDRPGDGAMNLGDNVRYYLDARNVDDLRPFLDGDRVTPGPGERREFADATAELRACLAALDDAGCDPVAFDLTTDGVREAGLVVTRTFVPELLPLCRPDVPPRGHPALDGADLVDRPHPIG